MGTRKPLAISSGFSFVHPLQNKQEVFPLLTQYELRLQPGKLFQPRAEWAYRLYTALLEGAPPSFASSVHEDGTAPISQFLRIGDGAPRWMVSLLGEQAEEALGPLLERQTVWRLKHDGVSLAVTQTRKRRILDADVLFERAAALGTPHALHFLTPTAFQSQGDYINLPTIRLLVQNLAKKWNDCFAETYPIEDTDGEGLDDLAAGLYCVDFRLSGRMYSMKTASIPGFVGAMAVENRLSGFHRKLLDVLLLFASFSGVGIKTALGMGGTLLDWQRKSGAAL